MKQFAKILVTGGNGQLASCLRKVAEENPNILFASREELDIASEDSVRRYFSEHSPEIVINTAAYTAVDAAETNEAEAYAMNADAVKLLAEACLKSDIALLHISTDYVFDGNATAPYTESDTPNPVTVYGKSKLAGEKKVVQTGLRKYAIVRTSWLYSNFGRNFYKTMLRLAETNKEVRVVADQTGCPTYAMHLAETLLEMATALNEQNSGIYHFSNSGETTWHGFAEAIFRESRLPVRTIPIASEEFPVPAKRPAYSVLSTEKLEKVFGLQVPSWQEGLKTCVKNI